MDAQYSRSPGAASVAHIPLLSLWPPARWRHQSASSVAAGSRGTCERGAIRDEKYTSGLLQSLSIAVRAVDRGSLVV